MAIIPMSVSRPRPLSRTLLVHRNPPAARVIAVLLSLCVLLPSTPLRACPFCSAVSTTLRQEMEVMDAVVIATVVEGAGPRNEDTGEVTMKIEKVLNGGDLVKVGQQVRASYFGDVTDGRRFLLQGVDPPQLQWATPLPVSERAEEYVTKVAELGDDMDQRLLFYYDYLQDEDSMLDRDTYDEFASAPYQAIKKLSPRMDHDQLIEWITDPEMSAQRKRLFLTMLGVCGDEKDLPTLEKMLRSTQKSSRGGLDALIACYLTLAGEKGLPLIDELFLANKKAPYADTYAAIMAIRFQGTEGDKIPRSALVESLHHVLDRTDLADLVIPDLARWSDWSQIDRLTKLFIDANADNNWVRVPVVNYLRACPLPEAKEAMKKLEEVDPESVRRANTFFSIPVPARDTGSSSSAVEQKSDQQIAAGARFSQPGKPTASLSPSVAATPVASAAPMNSWRLAYVLSLAMGTLMIGQFLLLAGGPQPAE
jgi:hypothetical protein